MAVDLAQFGIQLPPIPRPPRMETPLVSAPSATVARSLGLPMAHPVRPGDPGYAGRIPPPADDGLSKTAPVPQTVDAVQQALNPSPVSQRLVISFGPRIGKVVLGIEVAPSWDIDESFIVSAAAVREMLPLLRGIIKIKDMTGGQAFVEDSGDGVESDR